MTTTVCKTHAEQFRELAKCYNEAGYGPMKFDPGFEDESRLASEMLGLADLPHL